MNKKKKILTIVGARPHFIKASMVSRAIAASPVLTEVLVHTGQHYDHELSGAFFAELELPEPAYNLGVGSGRQARQLGLMIMRLDEVLQAERPDLVLVYGDTNSTAAGAIAAAKNHIPLAHIEAGLREHDRAIPEEINKLLTDAVTDLYFSPTQTGVDNLAAIGKHEHVYRVGDVGIDLVRAHLDRIEARAPAVLDRFGLAPGQYYLLTCHRAANTDHPEHLEAILEAVGSLDLPVLFPIHPRTRQAVEQYGLEECLATPNLKVIAPLGFWDTQCLLRHARMTITDSGGITKEAYFHRTPAILIDRQTEWVETVREGWNQIAGPDKEKIRELIATFKMPATHSDCLGDGRAAERIVAVVERYLHTGKEALLEKTTPCDDRQAEVGDAYF